MSLGDWPLLNISGLTKERLRWALEYPLSWHTWVRYPEKNGRAQAYSFDKKHFVLYWIVPEVTATSSATSSIVAFPTPMGLDAVTEFIWEWLQTADYGEQPDHDGSNSKGWEVYLENWGQVDGRFESLVGVRPWWAMHGK